MIRGVREGEGPTGPVQEGFSGAPAASWADVAAPRKTVPSDGTTSLDVCPGWSHQTDWVETQT